MGDRGLTSIKPGQAETYTWLDALVDANGNILSTVFHDKLKVKESRPYSQDKKKMLQDR